MNTTHQEKSTLSQVADDVTNGGTSFPHTGEDERALTVHSAVGTTTPPSEGLVVVPETPQAALTREQELFQKLEHVQKLLQLQKAEKLALQQQCEQLASDKAEAEKLVSVERSKTTELLVLNSQLDKRIAEIEAEHIDIGQEETPATDSNAHGQNVPQVQTTEVGQPPLQVNEELQAEKSMNETLRKQLSDLQEKVDKISSIRQQFEDRRKRRVEFNKLIGSLPTFRGDRLDNIKLFFADLTLLIRQNSQFIWDDEDKISAVLKGLKGAALDWVNLCHPEHQSFKELKEVLTAYFWNVGKQLEVRNQLLATKFQLNETVVNYTTRVYRAARTLDDTNYKMNDQAVIEILILGLKDTSWYSTISMSKIAGKVWGTFLEFQDYLRSIETFSPPLAFVATSEPVLAVTEVEDKGKDKKYKKEKKTKKEKDLSNVQCFKCKKYGHLQRNCPEKKRKREPEKEEKKEKHVHKSTKKPCWFCDKEHKGKCPELTKAKQKFDKENKSDSNYLSVENSCQTWSPNKEALAGLVQNKEEVKHLSASFLVGNQIVTGVIDSGCRHVLISDRIFNKLGYGTKNSLRSCETKLAGANSSSLPILGIATVSAELLDDTYTHMEKFEISEYSENSGNYGNLKEDNKIGYFKYGVKSYMLDVVVVKNLAVDFLIGLNAWKCLGIVINFPENYLQIANRKIRIYKERISVEDESVNFVIEPGFIGFVECKTTCPEKIYVDGLVMKGDAAIIPIMGVAKNGKLEIPIWNMGKKPVKFSHKDVVLVADEEFTEEDEAATEDFDINKVIVGDPNPKRVAKIKKILRKFRKIFREKTQKGDRWKGEPAHFLLKNNYVPQQDKMFAKRPEDHERTEKEVQQLAERDLVYRASGRWRANTVLLRKKDGTTRFAIDYRSLNSQSEVIAFPMPLISEIIANLHGTKFMSKVDFCDGFWSIPIDEESQELTGFATRSGMWKWKVCPQGYSGSPAIFQKAVFETLGDMAWKSAMPYIDDVIIYSKSFKDHLRHLEELFTKLANAGFYLKLRKCEFLMQEMEYLGHKISINGISPSAEKIQAILKMPVPKNSKGVKRFLGLGSYYRRFIPKFAERTTNMRRLTRSKVKFEWSQECQWEFEDIQMALTSKPIIAFPDWERPFVLSTDASKKGLGAVLSQRFPEGERVIEYASRGVTQAEANYSISELECLAVMWAVEKFNMYLAVHKFELITDHKALKSLKKIKSNNPRLFRWSLKLAELDYDVTYRPGKDHLNVDPLSRDVPELANLVLFLNKEEADVYIRKFGKIEIDLETGETKIVYQKGCDTWEITPDGKIWNIPNGQPHRRLFIDTPKEKRQILKAIHESGHFGGKKCYQTLQRRYFWKGMEKDCKMFCMTCPVCQERNAPRKNQGGNLGRIIAKNRNELVGIDLFGGLPKSPLGYKKILVITDYVTKYTLCVPVKSKKPVEIAKALYDTWVVIVGLPEKIQSDQGKEFTADVCKALYNVLMIRKLQTSGYHPQANGQVERFNKTMADMLAKLCSDDQINWPDYVGTIVMEYNAMIHAVTGESPHFLMFGKEFRLPIDIIKRAVSQKGKDWVNSLLPELMERLDKAIQRINKNHEHNAKYYNKKRTPHTYKVGDRVMYKIMVRTKASKGVHKKISKPMIGPFEITHVNDDGNTVKILYKGKETTVNVMRLKPCYERPAWMLESPEDSENSMDVEFEHGVDHGISGKPIELENPKKESSEIDESLELPEEEISEISEIDELPEVKKIPKEEISKIFKEPTTGTHPLCIKKTDFIVGLPVDVLVKNHWKCGVIQKIATKRNKTKKLEVRVVGKDINAWTSPFSIRLCKCSSKDPKEATPKEKKLVEGKKYWKVGEYKI